MGRRELREHIFKLLFMDEFHSAEDMKDQLANYREGLERATDQEWDFIVREYNGVWEHRDQIDALLNEYSTGWKTSRMARVDIAILRLGVYEMKYCGKEVPLGVAINEAVELAKTYGGEDSGSFVNAVLGKIARGNRESPEKEPSRPPKSHAKIILRSGGDKESSGKEKASGKETGERRERKPSSGRKPYENRAGNHS